MAGVLSNAAVPAEQAAWPGLLTSPRPGQRLPMVSDAAGQLSTLDAPLTRYLRMLWAVQPAPVLAASTDVAAPFITGRVIHLPPRPPAGTAVDAWHWQRAAAAHAAAHLVFSPPVFDGTGLPPITRAVMGVLEDARVEALALRELPGLRRLWLPLHTASAALGDGFEALLLRLARALLDPAYVDPHPWVAKGRRLFYVEPGSQILALRRPDELLAAARRLGHDIGQMRMAFNPRQWRPGPSYRDDQRWMWPAPQATQPETAGAQPSASTALAPPPPPDTPPPQPTATLQRYPEWDRLIRRLRPQWCSVADVPAEPSGTSVAGPSAAAGPAGSVDVRVRFDGAVDGRAGAVVEAVVDGRADGRADGLVEGLGERLVDGLVDGCSDARLQRRLAQVLRQDQAQPQQQPATCGEHFDLDALVRHRLARRLRQPVDGRVYRNTQPSPRGGRAMVVIDQSSSSAVAWAGQGGDAGATSLLQASRRIARLLAAAWQQAGVATAICGFSSNGRHQVVVRSVKAFQQPLDGAALARLAGLRSGQSTRLGAAVRHATRQVLAAKAGGDGPRQVLIISDGEPWDVDVHDRRYLPDDIRQAVRQAARQGVVVRCLVMPAAGSPGDQPLRAELRHMFGPRHGAVLHRLDDLPRRMRQIGR